METNATKNDVKKHLHETHNFGQLAQMLVDIRKVISQYPEPMGIPDKKKAYTVDQWNRDVSISNKAHEFNKELKENKQLSENKRLEIESAIKKVLPAPHIWFITDDATYAVALQENDWPGTPTEILIKENPVYDDLPELKCIRSNFN